MLPALYAQVVAIDPAQTAQARGEDLTYRVQTVSVRARPPPRSASDWEVDHDTITATPHETAADVLGVLPGVYVSNRGLLGQAPNLSLRGFAGSSGENTEVFVGNIPMNQTSHIRAPGYADLRLIPPEVIRDARVSHGPYDPRQGDGAIAGTTRLDLGLEKPGFWGKASGGSFGARRLYLACAPDASARDEWTDTFAAFETYAIDGPGGGRGGERSSFVGQLSNSGSMAKFRGILAVGSARFDFPGLLPQSAVERGEYPYDTTQPLGRDQTTQALIGLSVSWEVGNGTLTIGAFGSKVKTEFHQNLTGYALDAIAGLPPTNADDFEQVNDASTYGLTTSYRHSIDALSERDVLEAGLSTRIDAIDQSDTRLNPDGTVFSKPVDATINITDLGAYADLSVFPWKRVVVRGGTRLDSLAYSVTDHAQNAGLDRTTQGFHVGNKATIDYLVTPATHLIASYGEGFRTPEARDLTEGQHVPFATVQSVEAGARFRGLHLTKTDAWQASLVGFGSWIDQDRVFDALTRSSIPAPSSSRLGAAAVMGARWGIFGTNVSATYARAVFTGSDANFRDGDPVPYAPRFVVRDDVFVSADFGKVGKGPVVGRVGVGVQGAAGTSLPGVEDGKDVFYADALASVAWRAFELSVNGMNLLGLRYYDTQYVYASNFDRGALPAPSAHVLVAPPTSVFATLQIHVGSDGGVDRDAFVGATRSHVEEE